MKRSAILISIIFILNNFSHNLSAEPMDDLPSIDKVQSIEFPNSLALTILPDGSGTIQAGSGPSDNAVIPKHTFVFKEVYSSLAPYITKENIFRDKEPLFIILRTSATNGNVAMYLNYKKVYYRLMAVAESRAISENAKFQELIRKRRNPPVSRDTPQ